MDGQYHLRLRVKWWGVPYLCALVVRRVLRKAPLRVAPWVIWRGLVIAISTTIAAVFGLRECDARSTNSR